MKKLLLSFSAIAVVLFAASCSKKESGPSNTANIMFVNGCPPAAVQFNIDGRVNNAVVSGATNLVFLRNSGYRAVAAASGATVDAIVSGQNTQLAAATADLAVGKSYTAFAGGTALSPTVIVTNDDLTAPTSGNAKVRFVNLCPDIAAISCYVGTAKLDSNIQYKRITPYYSVAAPSAAVKIGMIDQAVLTNAGLINAQQLVAGKIYTFLLTGTASGTGSSALTLTAIGNN